MNTLAEKKQENRGQSTTRSVSQKPELSQSLLGLVDNRPEAAVQQKLKDLANNSVQAKHTAQLQAATGNHSSQINQQRQKPENNTGLPDNLKAGIENLSGMSLDDVEVHRNSDKPAQLKAHAYAQGTHIHLGPGQEKFLPHEAWHVVQQKQGRVKPTIKLKGFLNANADTVLEREADVMGKNALHQKKGTLSRYTSNGTPRGVIQQYRREEDVLSEVALAVVPSIVATGRLKVLNYLARGLGKGGASFSRSDELRAFRAKLKGAARAQAWGDIMHILDNQKDVFSNSDLDIGPAMQDHLAVVAKDLAYEQAKALVDITVLDIATDWLDRVWNNDAIFSAARLAAENNARRFFNSRDPDSITQVVDAAQSAAFKVVDNEVRHYISKAKAAKNEVLKPVNPNEKRVAAQDQQRIAGMVATSANRLGLKTLRQAIKANTTEEGLGIVGRLIDKVIPMPGEQISIDISLQIPTGDGVSYVILKLGGKAGRGITGFSTSGVATLGDPKRLEIMAQFSVGVGAETFGLKGNLSVGFFTRAGSDAGTHATMKALSYAGYRAATGLSDAFGNWWAGGGRGSVRSRVERAEMWAAGIEDLIFKVKGEDADLSDKNTFADVGGYLSGIGGINVKDVFSAEIGIGGEVFKRYDTDSLKKSLGASFATRVAGEKEARSRRKNASGRTTSSVGYALSIKARVNQQSVTFAGSLSMENDFYQNVAKDNWGIEISATIEAGDDKLSQIEQIVSGIVAGAVGTTTAIAKLYKEINKSGTGIDFLGDLTQMVNAGLNNQITNGLGEAWSVGGSQLDMGIGASGIPDAAPGIKTSSSLQLAITFGRSGGRGVFRFEIRDSKNLEINVGMGSVGLTVSAAKGRRILAVGWEDKGWATELIGLRGSKGKF